MNRSEFNQWRQDYDTLTFEEQLAFYQRYVQDHPKQCHFSPGGLRLAFGEIPLDEFRVLELGGWTGQAAEMMLEVRGDITTWTNVEISGGARNNPVCEDPRYHTLAPRALDWGIPLPQDCNVFVALHVLEHVKAVHVRSIIAQLPASIVYAIIEAPIKQSGTNNEWHNYYGSHVLELGWKQVEALLGEYSFVPMKHLKHDTFRVYERYYEHP